MFIAGATLCCALSFLQCTPALTDGNSSETTNVAIVTSNGLPAVSAKVKLIDAGNWAYLAARQENVVLDSAITGPDGTVSFAAFPEAACNLQIDHESAGIVVPDFSRNGKVVGDADVIRLVNYATLKGTCVAGNSTATYAILDGTSYRSVINADGSFAFPDVAPAVYSLVIGNTSGNLSLAGTALLVEGATLTSDTISPLYTSLLIDDFESGDTTNVLGRLTDGYWYTYDDTHDGGHSTISTSILQGGTLHGSSALDVGIVLRQVDGVDIYAGIGIYLGTSRFEWDLSTMTAITFWAKGKNTLRVSIESRLVDSIQSWPDFGKTITLDSTWRHFSIPVDSLDLRNSIAADLGITWAMAAKRIYRIEFEASEACSNMADSVKLQLDDIRIEGVAASDFFLHAGSAP